MDKSHRDILKAKRMDLARDLDVNTAVSYLYSQSIFTENDKDEILALKTPQERSEKLLDILPKRGPEAFDVFVKFLDERQPFLSKLLKPNTSMEESKQPVDNMDSPPAFDKKPSMESEGDLKPQETTDATPAESKEDGFSSQDTKEAKEEGNADQGDGSRSSRLFLKSSTYKDGVNSDFMYPMEHRPRGQAFIINNKSFLPASGMQKYPRNGTDVDAEALYKLFRALEFETKVYKDQSSKEIMNIFDHYASMDQSSYDCIICAILTHGEEGLIYSTDGKIMLKELTTKFRTKNLHGKPKLFFFQACQGFEYMEGVEETDGPSRDEEMDEIDAPGNNKITLPVEADFLYAYSTVPGYYSWRNSVRGSWFVQAIVSVFREHAQTMDVLRMMTRVNAEVAKQKSNTNDYFSDNKKQIPSIISQLRKELYFFPENVLEGQP
ncbi:caspase-3-like isoform X2 [Dendronephthya gigantea]|uniref:caspase-3-like isoform X2 n=1 Tax=Dendronephthya gigantea TaxID=151771 RepID=UPI00106CA0B2|nr:caspase-3-like isoform X2 [Dendronephthya gigantea]